MVLQTLLHFVRRAHPYLKGLKFDEVHFEAFDEIGFRRCPGLDKPPNAALWSFRKLEAKQCYQI